MLIEHPDKELMQPKLGSELSEDKVSDSEECD